MASRSSKLPDLPSTPIGMCIQGIIKLKNAGFSKDEIEDINISVHDVLRYLLTYYAEHDIEFHFLIASALEELIDGIIELKRNGFTTEEITDLVSDIAYSYEAALPNDSNDLWTNDNDDDFDDDEDFDDDDFDDDDEDDDDDSIDPRKFFPGK